MTEPALRSPAVDLRVLIDVEASRLLGISGDDFRRRWYAHGYEDDPSPAVRALDLLMRTGRWLPPGEAEAPAGG
ncbi:MAG TPA: hypothetical protein VMI11_00695 [Actinomycetes bacterium]|nr:hypothetical protein [Actinomycetes bacterium]